MTTFDDDPGWADETRFRDLFSRYSRRVYAYARRQTDASTAESVVQDVFTSAWRRASSIPDEPLPWLLAVARKSLLTHWRSQSRQKRLAERVAGLSRTATHASLEASVVDRAELLEALNRLSDDDREALLLVGWDGLSHSDAATVAGCSTAAFTTRVNRARARLQKHIDPSNHLFTLVPRST